MGSIVNGAHFKSTTSEPCHMFWVGPMTENERSASSNPYGVA